MNRNVESPAKSQSGNNEANDGSSDLEEDATGHDDNEAQGPKPRWKKRNSQNHLAGERRRRHSRKAKLDSLAALLPGIDKRHRPTKAMILEAAVTAVRKKLAEEKARRGTEQAETRAFSHMHAFLKQDMVGVASVRLGDPVVRNSNSQMRRVLLGQASDSISLDGAYFPSFFDRKESQRLLPAFLPHGPPDSCFSQVVENIQCALVDQQVQLEIVVDMAVRHAVVFASPRTFGHRSSVLAAVESPPPLGKQANFASTLSVSNLFSQPQAPGPMSLLNVNLNLSALDLYQLHLSQQQPQQQQPSQLAPFQVQQPAKPSSLVVPPGSDAAAAYGDPTSYRRTDTGETTELDIDDSGDTGTPTAASVPGARGSLPLIGKTKWLPGPGHGLQLEPQDGSERLGGLGKAPAKRDLDASGSPLGTLALLRPRPLRAALPAAAVGPGANVNLLLSLAQQLDAGGPPFGAQIRGVQAGTQPGPQAQAANASASEASPGITVLGPQRAPGPSLPLPSPGQEPAGRRVELVASELAEPRGAAVVASSTGIAPAAPAAEAAARSPSHAGEGKLLAVPGGKNRDRSPGPPAGEAVAASVAAQDQASGSVVVVRGGCVMKVEL